MSYLNVLFSVVESAWVQIGILAVLILLLVYYIYAKFSYFENKIETLENILLNLQTGQVEQIASLINKEIQRNASPIPDIDETAIPEVAPAPQEENMASLVSIDSVQEIPVTEPVISNVTMTIMRTAPINDDSLVMPYEGEETAIVQDVTNDVSSPLPVDDESTSAFVQSILASHEAEVRHPDNTTVVTQNSSSTTKTTYSQMKVAQLRLLAMDRNLRIPSKSKKQDIIDLLVSNERM